MTVAGIVASEAYGSLDELLIVLASLGCHAALVASSNRVELCGGNRGREHLDSCSIGESERGQSDATGAQLWYNLIYALHARRAIAARALVVAAAASVNIPLPALDISKRAKPAGTGSKVRKILVTMQEEYVS